MDSRLSRFFLARPRSASPVSRALIWLIVFQLPCVLASATTAMARQAADRHVRQEQLGTVKARAESLRIEAEQRLQKLSELPDSAQTQSLDGALQELGGVIDELGQELSRLEFHIEDRAISLRDGSGGRVRINIPPNLGDRISRGLSEITATILKEIPDTLRLGSPALDSSRVLRVPRIVMAPPVAPATPTPRKVVGGDVVRLWSDVVVAQDEAIDGDVVAIFGDVVVHGRVTGSVVTVLGNATLTGRGEVGNAVIVVLGRLERHERAKIMGSQFALGPGVTLGLDGLKTFLWGGWVALAVRAVLFTFMALLLALLFAVIPADRLRAVLDTGCVRPGECLIKGLGWMVLGHLVLVFVMGILIMTLIGIPLALLIGLAYLAFAALAISVAAYRVGRRVRDWLRLPWQHVTGLALLGLCALHLPGFVGSLIGLVPGWLPLAIACSLLGLVIKLLAFAFGVGALVASRCGRAVASRVATPPPPDIGPAPAQV